jgi:hypothetical protein
LLAQSPSVFVRHPGGGGSSGDPPRLKHQHSPGDIGTGSQQGRGDTGGFAGTRRGAEHGRRVFRERSDQIRQNLIDGQRDGF